MSAAGQQRASGKSKGARSLGSHDGMRLESMLASKLKAPKQVCEFAQFEELSKLYAIEQPFVARTQIELLFDVYDGRKLRSASSLDADIQEAGAEQEPTGGGCGKRESSSARRNSQYLGADEARRGDGRRSIVGTLARQSAGSGGQLATWCRLLFAGRRSRLAAASVTCCLAPSDTHQELGLISASSSGESLSGPLQLVSELPAIAQVLSCPVATPPRGQTADDNDKRLDSERELSIDAARLVLGAFGGGGGCTSAEPNATLANGLLVQPAQLADMLASGGQLALDSGFGGQFDITGACQAVSVCLLARRRLHGGAPSSGALGIEDKVARNGRQWARASAHLLKLRRRLRDSRAPLSAAPNGKNAPTSKQTNTAKQQLWLGRQLEWAARRAARKYWHELKRDWHCLELDSSAAGKTAANSRRLRRDSKHLDELVELVKVSVNQLIDAQLLLRNKLTGTSEQPSSILAKSEHENLLRNNFNLLKIWQNLEESKKLVCFVCEPIKANLADLFYFNRQRQDWPSSQLAFETSNLNLFTATNSASPLASNSKCLLFVSPLVCLDVVQVKRGLLQILEALNYLHAICKLIHRNVAPRNILIGQHDNWKLSGLEFAIRFESTAISESNSMMVHELSSSGAAYRFGLYAAGSSAQQQQLRRQRTLHQTKCQEFSRLHKCPLLQPDLDYLAPEIWNSAKCSHKSDIFSYGLVLGQTFDLCRHRAPLDCRNEPANYEPELKKFAERRRDRLAHWAPIELRQGLLEALESEPNLRPSANYLLQLFKRPIELCRANEDSLRHLKSTLGYLDSRLALGAPSTVPQQQIQLLYNGSQQNISGSASVQTSQQPPQQQQQLRGRQFGPARIVSSYFRRVTSASAQRDAHKRQTRSLRLLNLLVRTLDSLTAHAGLQRNEALAELYINGEQQAAAGSGLARRASFGTLWLQFEQTLETLRQVYRTSALTLSASGQQAPTAQQQPLSPAVRCAAGASCPLDSRTLLLIVALHRRLLEQVALMRAELPPVSRLMACQPGATLSAANHQELAVGAGAAPTTVGLAGANHRALADAEDKLVWLASKHSLGRLAESLADPLLKLDEFLLAYELLNDLLVFVGQKCKQSFAQRGKQLLNDLTPVTGCPSLSSSEEDDEDELLACQYYAGLGAEQQHADVANKRRPVSRSQINLSAGAYVNQAQVSRMNQPHHNQQHRFSDHDAYVERHQTASGRASVASSAAASAAGSRPSSRQQQYFQLPTSINITAPSPMGSQRDMSARVSADSQQLETQLGAGSAPPARHFKAPAALHDEPDALTHMASQLSLGARSPARSRPADYQSGGANMPPDHLAGQQLAGGEPGAEQAACLALDDARQQDDGQQQGPDDDKSRSQLIDELLRTINDDSFNEYIDFNNRLVAAARTPGQQANQLDSSQMFEQRPRSAIDGVQQQCGTSPARNHHQQQQQQLAASPGARPRTLNLTQSGASAQMRSAVGRSSVCIATSHHQQQQGSTFDNVIRRMSTNLVQNLTNKMSSSTQLANGGEASSASYLDTSGHQAISPGIGNNLRREKSSTSTNTAYTNSLYVDNQVPARRHSDNTINVPRIQVALSSPQASASRTNLNQRASVSASKLANKWKTTAKSNQREAADKLSPNISGALSYMRRHSSGNTTDKNGNQSDQNQSNGIGAQLLNVSPFKKKQETRSSSNLGLDFLLSNRSMKRRYSAASMLGHQTQKKAEDLIDAGMKSVQNMFS